MVTHSPRGMPKLQPSDTPRTYPTVQNELVNDLEGLFAGVEGDIDDLAVVSDSTIFTPATNVTITSQLGWLYPKSGLTHVRLSLTVNKTWPSGVQDTSLGTLVTSFHPQIPGGFVGRTSYTSLRTFLCVTDTLGHVDVSWSPAAMPTGQSVHLDFTYERATI